ncbi:3-oxoacyl-ACP synthase III family protein [Mucilaginibacter arboris]|uniref:Ketoacyl-ACP synthase III n=1 Tax=Mucilaginibacter arboris TaxID=2682090 RepID=A0A7K1SSH0_9SPHI|nr:ketoacyl-ACP synthase III [Mucilaginibacter arboris]MVN20245.1 ketoacyl-ACP synthase III [Mucilaginibacter arboris]
MQADIRSVIVATGSYIPEVIITSTHFINHRFFEKNGNPIAKTNEVILDQFKNITEIEERRYAKKDQNTSDLGFLAAKDALESSGIDGETLDYIIVAHNFGDIAYGTNRVDLVPTLAARIKQLLQIKNPDCVAYDLPFGCPGWVEGVIQANYFLKSGDAKRCMVIGAEVLSRITDPHDRDTMIYADGAGAVILEAVAAADVGILAHKTQSHAVDYADLLTMGPSFAPEKGIEKDLFIKMNGRKLYEYALVHVPQVIKMALDKANVCLYDIKKVLIHQANGKMDTAIMQRVFKLYGEEEFPAELMPMNISHYGNSSVATVPTLLDTILKGKMEGQAIHPGDKILFASVGAGMNINAIVYQN